MIATYQSLYWTIHPNCFHCSGGINTHVLLRFKQPTTLHSAVKTSEPSTAPMTQHAGTSLFGMHPHSRPNQQY
jgi:hypothetical protein